MRVHVRRPLAGEIGQEQQAFGTRWHRGRGIDQDGERVEAVGGEQVGLAATILSRNQPSEPPADRITPIRW